MLLRTDPEVRDANGWFGCLRSAIPGSKLQLQIWRSERQSPWLEI